MLRVLIRSLSALPGIACVTGTLVLAVALGTVAFAQISAGFSTVPPRLEAWDAEMMKKETEILSFETRALQQFVSDPVGLKVISIDGRSWLVGEDVFGPVTEAVALARDFKWTDEELERMAYRVIRTIFDERPLPVASTASRPALDRIVPRRYKTLDDALGIRPSVVAASTTLLVPFAVRDLSDDTGIAIANTTADPFGVARGDPGARLGFDKHAYEIYRLGLSASAAVIPVTINPEVVNAASMDPDTQNTTAVLSFMDGPGVMSRAAPVSPNDMRWTLARLLRPAVPRFSLASNPARRTSSRWPAESAPQTASGAGIKVFVTSLGRLGADAFRVVIVNASGAPVTLRSSVVRLEPVARLTERDLQRELAALSRFSRLTLTARGYCLEREKDPPAAGMVFRVAPASVQAQGEPVSRLLRIAERLRDQKALNPDTDPEDYYHSIVQWAIWAQQEGFDQRAFEAAFTAYTRKNVVAAGERWSREIEDAVREIVPNRWRDVSRIVAETLKEPPTGKGSREGR